MRKTIIIIIAICFALTLGLTPTLIASAKGENLNEKALNSALSNYNSRSAYVIDYDTGKVLFERKPEDKYPIASMVKIMTLNLAFDEIKKGNLALDEKITISETASSMGGSQMFLDTGLEYSVSDLIKGIIVVSANDASVALAERISGNVDSFIELMNNKARDFGMQNTRFVNVTGLPQEGQYSTAKDVTIMMKNLLKHPKYYDFSSIYLENYTHPDGRKTELTNTNKLVRFYKGCDGGKTGFTNDAMFCLSATAKRDDTRVIATVLGAPTSKERNKEITDLFNFAFANYKTVKLIEKDKPIPTKVEIKGAKEKNYEICVDKDIFILSKRNEKPQFDVEVTINDSLKAPISKGVTIGQIKLIDKTTKTVIDEANLVTMKDIHSKSFMDGLREILENWFINL